jgi:hypothetical protein
MHIPLRRMRRQYVCGDALHRISGLCHLLQLRVGVAIARVEQSRSVRAAGSRRRARKMRGAYARPFNTGTTPSGMLTCVCGSGVCCESTCQPAWHIGCDSQVKHLAVPAAPCSDAVCSGTAEVRSQLPSTASRCCDKRRGRLGDVRVVPAQTFASQPKANSCICICRAMTSNTASLISSVCSRLFVAAVLCVPASRRRQLARVSPQACQVTVAHPSATCSQQHSV